MYKEGMRQKTEKKRTKKQQCPSFHLLHLKDVFTSRRLQLMSLKKAGQRQRVNEEEFGKGCQLRRTEEEGHICTYLYIREEHLEHIRARVAGVEKHELGFLQMIGRETLLDLNLAAIKDINNCLEGNNLWWIKQMKLLISQIQYVHANNWQ